MAGKRSRTTQSSGSGAQQRVRLSDVWEQVRTFVCPQRPPTRKVGWHFWRCTTEDILEMRATSAEGNWYSKAEYVQLEDWIPIQKILVMKLGINGMLVWVNEDVGKMDKCGRQQRGLRCPQNGMKGVLNIS